MRCELKGRIVKFNKVDGKTKNGKTFIDFDVVDRMSQKNKLSKDKDKDAVYNCKAFGNVALSILKNCNIKDKKGNFIERKIDLYGTLELYDLDVVVNISNSLPATKVLETFNISKSMVSEDLLDSNVNIKLDKVVPTEMKIFSVTDMEYADYVGEIKDGIAVDYVKTEYPKKDKVKKDDFSITLENNKGKNKNANKEDKFDQQYDDLNEFSANDDGLSIDDDDFKDSIKDMIG